MKTPKGLKGPVDWIKRVDPGVKAVIVTAALAFVLAFALPHDCKNKKMEHSGESIPVDTSDVDDNTTDVIMFLLRQPMM